MSKLPTVSIIIPYNKDRGFLKEAKESVVKQTYKGEIDLILSHDPFASVSENINNAWPVVTGKYVKFFAEDDMLTPICIEESVSRLEETGADFIHGNAFNKFDNENRAQYPVHEHPTLEQMLHNNVIHGLTLMYRTETIQKMIDNRGFWFDESLNCAEEYDVNLWLMKNGYKLDYVRAFLGKYRRHKEQKSLGAGVDQVARAKRIQAIKNRYL